MKQTRWERSYWRGLYAITDASLRGDSLAERVEQAIAGGARVIQYRDKSNDPNTRQAEASALLQVCRRAKVPLLINDDVDLATHIEADGVHLGRDDTAYAEARARLGADSIIGVSCYNQPELALQAAQRGADYVAFGRFYPSQSKPNAVQASAEMLSQTRAQIDCPIVAIGGISAENGAPLIAAGADMLAVIRGIFATDDVYQAARSVHLLFHSTSEAHP